MKKGLTFILALLLSFAAISQTTSYEVGVGRGAYGDTYKQVGINYLTASNYVLKASFGIDRIEDSKALGVRQTWNAGAGAFVTKEVELFVEGSAAFDRKNGDHKRTQFGATVGGNYHFKRLSLGVQYNTIPVWDTPNGVGRSPFPTAVVGFKL